MNIREFLDQSSFTANMSAKEKSGLTRILGSMSCDNCDLQLKEYFLSRLLTEVIREKEPDADAVEIIKQTREIMKDCARKTGYRNIAQAIDQMPPANAELVALINEPEAGAYVSSASLVEKSI